jgi:hypothetical protein
MLLRNLKLLLVATFVVFYGALVYVASLDFRHQVANGGITRVYEVLRHAVLIPGLIPLVVALGLTISAAGFKQLFRRTILILGFGLLHFAVAAISAHDDSWFPVAQLLEIFAAVLLLWYCLRKGLASQ